MTHGLLAVGSSTCVFFVSDKEIEHRQAAPFVGEQLRDVGTVPAPGGGVYPSVEAAKCSCTYITVMISNGRILR